MRLNVQGKLYALAGVLLLFLLVTGALAIRNLGSVNTLGGSMYGDRVVPLVQLGEARALLGDIDSQIQRNISDPPKSATFAAAAAKDAAGIDQQIQAYEATMLVDSEKAGLADFHTKLGRVPQRLRRRA